MTAAWVIRSGRHGERDEWAIEQNVSGGGWKEVPDLTHATTRAEVEAIINDTFAAASAGARAGYTGQIWALRGRIQIGDLLIMPMKTTRELAMGRVTSGYRYLDDASDPNRRHVLGVDWSQRVPRSLIKQDLLYTLGSAISIFSPSRNNAVARLEYVFKHGEDPGAAVATQVISRPAPALDSDDDLIEEASAQPDVAELVHNQIIVKIGEEFAGHGFAHLVAAILRAEGFDADEAPPGVDGGIDITAGRGLLGLESPKIIVQVKTGKVGSEVIAQLNGLVQHQGADYGLIVSWAGLSKPAHDAVKQQRFRVKAWESADVIDAVLRNYERLPESVTSRLPLQRVWMLNGD